MRSPRTRPTRTSPCFGTVLHFWKLWRNTPPDWTLTGPLSCRFPTQLPVVSLQTGQKLNRQFGFSFPTEGFHLKIPTSPPRSAATLAFVRSSPPWWQPQDNRAGASGGNSSVAVTSRDRSPAPRTHGQHPVLCLLSWDSLLCQMSREGQREAVRDDSGWTTKDNSRVKMSNLSYRAQFLLWGQYWQVCLLVRMSGSLDRRLGFTSLSTQVWMWWTKVFLSFSSSEEKK